jgi:predicted O-methyltransferase YrrM
MWANALKRQNRDGMVVCVDPWMNANGESDLLAFQRNIRRERVEPYIRTVRKKSTECLPFLPVSAFDIVYVDGAHDYLNVKHDIEMGLDLLKPDGLLCGDDLTLQISDLLDPPTVARLSQERERLPEWHFGVAMAVHQVLGRVNESHGFWWK